MVSPAFTSNSAQSGELDAKEVLTISGIYGSYRWVVDGVLGCKVFGAFTPGFGLEPPPKTVLAYGLLDEGQAPGTVRSYRQPDNVQLPIVPPLPSLDFGADVHLPQRRTMRIAF